MNIKELKRKLTAAGCRFEKEKSNHEWWYSPHTNKHFPIQRHGSLEVGTNLLHQIEKQAGVKL